MIATISKSLHVTEMSDGEVSCLEVIATPRQENETPIMVLKQGPDTIWIDAAGAEAIGEFLCEWAQENGA